MELKIWDPKEDGFVKEIEWNNEELKSEISAKMQEYRTLVFTEETIKDAKKDRADLNKLKNALENERKRIKKAWMEPYTKFEAQMKEVTSMIDEPIQLIDAQIKEVEQMKKEQKRTQIEELFRQIGFQTFVTLDSIWDEKWLNASVPLSKVEEQMKSRMYQIGTEVAVIHKLPEFSFEAMEIYKSTLSLDKAVQEGQRLSEIQKRKAAYEEQQRRIREAEEARKAEAKKAEEQKAASGAEGQAATAKPDGKTEAETAEPSREAVVEERYTIYFRVTATREQLDMLKHFMIENRIQYGPVPKKGE